MLRACAERLDQRDRLESAAAAGADTADVGGGADTATRRVGTRDVLRALSRVVER